MHLTLARRPQLVPRTILVADVSETSGRVYAAICHVAGWHVITCTPAELSEPLPIDVRPDIALLGIVESTPVAPRLRGPGTVPFILISSAAVTAASARLLGYEGVLTRPVRPMDLRTAISAVLERNATRERPWRAFDHDPVYRNTMRQIFMEEFEALRETSRELRRESRELCRYAGLVRADTAVLATAFRRTGEETD